jgi:hypothetical protein
MDPEERDNSYRGLPPLVNHHPTYQFNDGSQSSQPQQDTGQQQQQQSQPELNDDDEETKAKTRLLNAQADYYEGLARKEKDPDAKALLQAQAQAARAQANLAELQHANYMPEDQKLRLQHEYAKELQDANNASQLAIANLRESGEDRRLLERIQHERDTLNQTQGFTAEQNQLNRQSQQDIVDKQETGANTRLGIQQAGEDRRASIRAGVDLRGQDITMQQHRDKTMVDLLSAQIEAGKLSQAKARDMWQAYVDQKKLPSEIMKNVGDAIAPLVPHLTSYKKGDIPIGFEQGGPMEIAMRQGGASSYDPSKYAANPVQIDMFDLAKQAGADFKKTSLPDPKTLFNTTVPNVPDPSSFQSSMSNVGPASSYIPQGLGMTPDEMSKLDQHLDMVKSRGA